MKKYVRKHNPGRRILELLKAKNRKQMIYMPALRPICGSISATILLGQTLYWWKINKGQAFYKFKEKCNHKQYKKGDSWCEELQFSRAEFNGAIKKIGFKLGKTGRNGETEEQSKEREKRAFIIYYRDRGGLTWWYINKAYLSKIMGLKT